MNKVNKTFNTMDRETFFKNLNDELLLFPDGDVGKKMTQFMISLKDNNYDYVKENYEFFKNKRFQLGLGCVDVVMAFCESTEIIDFLINKCQIMRLNENYLMLVSSINQSVEVVRYLIEDLNQDPKKIDGVGNNSFMLACEKNSGALNVIKYLRNKIGDGLHHSNYDNCNAFDLACKKNENIEVIKYLINEMNINEKYHNSCIMNAAVFNPNHSVAKYMIEKTNIQFNSYEIASNLKNYDDMNNLVTELSNGTHYKRFNNLLVGLIDYIPSKLNLKNVNPLMIDGYNFERIIEKNILMPNNILASINKLKESSNNVYDAMMNCIPYHEFKDMVALLNHDLKIPWSKSYDMKRTIYFVDHGQQSQKLFTVGDQSYYGDRSIIYHTMILFKDVPLDNAGDGDVVPELSVYLPRYLVSMYLQSCYDGSILLECIRSNDDMIQFLRFIDQYPTINVSIQLLEKQIVQFMLEKKVVISQYVIEICEKYRLRYMYMMIGQKYFYDSSHHSFYDVHEF